MFLQYNGTQRDVFPNKNDFLFRVIYGREIYILLCVTSSFRASLDKFAVNPAQFVSKFFAGVQSGERNGHSLVY